MTADRPSHLMPRLRFPDFKDDPSWLAPQLAELYDFKRTNTLSRNKLNYVTGTIRNIHYGDIHTKFKPLFRVVEEDVPYINPDVSANAINDDAFCEEGDIVLADASEDLDDVGKAIEIVSLGGERLVAGTHTILATRRGSVPVLGFGGQLFQSASVRAGVRKEAQGAKVYGISAKRISDVPIPVPPTKDEQQKIADCLGSLDDLIAAEGRKLEALRQHKQGLLQQLFPEPGETQPLLRFTEFRDAPDWEQTALGTRLDRPPEYGVNAPAVPFSEDLPAYIRITDIDDNGWFVPAPRVSVDIEPSEDQFLHPGDIVLARTGASVGKSYRYRVEDGRLVFAGFLIRVRPNLDRLVPEFLSAYLSTWSYWDWVRLTSERSGQPGINGSEYASMPLTMPTHAASASEQRKIGDCVAVLDEGIAEQRQKLRALKCHKNGMLQQLFPTPRAI